MSAVETYERRVPVEHRWWGLDRRSIPYAVVAFAVLALWAWVLPWVADQVAWDDPIRPGEAIQVTDEVTMTAAPGWGVVSGLRTSDETRSGQRAAPEVVLVKDGAALSILQGPFEESPARLLDQAELITGATVGDDGFVVVGEVADRTTSAGLRGVTQQFSSGRNVGSVTTFVVAGTGIEIQVVGPEAQMAAQAAEVAAMIDSLAAEDGSSR